MAASSAANDYVHRVSAGLGVPYREIRGVPLETGEAPTIEGTASPTEAVVVELGDNVQAGGAAGFQPAYAALLAQMKGAAKIVCTTTWWNSTEVNTVINTECPKVGGKVVYISDLQPFDIRPGGEDYFVDLHPHDNSMKVIADRILAALQG